MTKTAPTDLLATLHAALAQTMSEALSAEQARIAMTKSFLELDTSAMSEEEMRAVSGILSLAPTARVDNALLKTIASFLKDNDITSDLSEGETADEIADKLAEMRAGRRRVPLPTDHLDS